MPPVVRREMAWDLVAGVSLGSEAEGFLAVTFSVSAGPKKPDTVLQRLAVALLPQFRSLK